MSIFKKKAEEKKADSYANEMAEDDRAFQYVLQDFSNVYIGPRQTYEALLEADDTPQRLRSAIYQYTLKDITAEWKICDHLLDIEVGSPSYMVYAQLKAQVAIMLSGNENATAIKTKKGTSIRDNQLSCLITDFLQDEAFRKSIEPWQIAEVRFAKLHLMSLGV